MSSMGEHPVSGYPTALGASSTETITLLGQDLARDVMGQVGFGELAFWLATQRRPTSGETRVFEAVLAALADHGFTPTAIVTRLTYLSAPDSIQGALAAGLLGGGSRFLGVTEDCGQFLHQVLVAQEGSLPADDDDAGWDVLALSTVKAQRAAGLLIPGLGHHVHKNGDPRTPRLLQIAAEEDVYGPQTCTARTSRSSLRLAGSIRRCSAGHCRSTVPGSAVRRWPTSACRWSCCAASHCSRVPPD
jgi:citrate synthase